MKRIIVTKISVIVMVLLATVSCKKEDVLTANEEASRPFQDSTNIVIGGGNTGGTGGGSTGGGTESFEFKIDGNTVSSTNPNYTVGPLGTVIMTSHVSSLTNFLQFGFFSEPSMVEVRPFGFSPSATLLLNVTNPSEIYNAIDGEMEITEVTSSKISGTFFFRAVQDPVVDTLNITEGKFTINK